MSEPDLKGARFEEVMGLMNLISTEGVWRPYNPGYMGLYIADHEVFGSPVSVRQQFHPKGLTVLSLGGQGWLLKFSVTKRRPTSFQPGQWSELAKITARDPDRKKLITPELTTTTLCVHTPAFIDPEKFRTQMTILRMFSSEWL
jgi:hypothetical protein